MSKVLVKRCGGCGRVQGSGHALMCHLAALKQERWYPNWEEECQEDPIAAADREFAARVDKVLAPVEYTPRTHREHLLSIGACPVCLMMACVGHPEPTAKAYRSWKPDALTAQVNPCPPEWRIPATVMASGGSGGPYVPGFGMAVPKHEGAAIRYDGLVMPAKPGFWREFWSMVRSSFGYKDGGRIGGSGGW
jgi:hypothetical protein